VFLVVAGASRWLVLGRTVLDWDESLYFLMARAWLGGNLPYTVIWDNKPPGIYAVFVVFSWVLGGWVGAMRVASVVCVGALATIVFRIVEVMGGGRGAAWLGGLLVVLVSLSNDGLAANTELFMAALTAGAVLAALTTRGGLLVGVLLGAAFMVKYVAVVEAPVVCGLFLWRVREWRQAAWLVAGGALPLAAVVLLYFLAGALPVFWADAVMSNVRRAAAPLTWGAVDYQARLQAGRWGSLYLVAVLCWFWPGLRRSHGWFLGLWLAAGLLGAVAAKSFYDHYFLQVLPVLCVTAALAWSRLPAGAGRWALAALVAAPPAWAGAAALAQARGPDAPAAAAAALNGAHARGLYVFDTQPILYALTGTTPPTRYVLPSVLTGPLLPAVADVDPIAELNRILASAPPFIARRTDPQNENPAMLDRLNQELSRAYHLTGTYGDIAVYQRDR
jgi:hypothetical protein